ncbi:MAG: class I SAM-dependent methyltransferase [bacterium]|nr:class I SAM-dependent methyltransferase [bacterium]
MSDSWDDSALEWDSNPVVREYAGKAFEQLTGLIDLTGLSVFDFGCGTGLLTEKLSPLVKSAVSLDTSPQMIRVLKEKNLPQVTAFCGALEDLKDPSGTPYPAHFDLVVASSVCAFVPDYAATLAQLRALLKPGGLLVQWDWETIEQVPGPGFTQGQVEAALRQAGFESPQVTRAFSMPFFGEEKPVLMAVAKA